MYSTVAHQMRSIGTLRVYEPIPAKNRIYRAMILCAVPDAGTTLPCVWKPKKGEQVFHPIVKSHFYLREVLAYEFADLIPDKVHVPTTVERTHGEDIGALQYFITNAVVGDYINMDYCLFMDLDQWRWAAAFDYVIGNSDRHSGNWMLDNKGKLWLIDHGCAFPDTNECWRGSIAVMRPMINRKVDVTDDIKDAFESNKDRYEMLLDDAGLVGSILPMLDRIDTLLKVQKFSDLVIER